MTTRLPPSDRALIYVLIVSLWIGSLFAFLLVLDNVGMCLIRG